MNRCLRYESIGKRKPDNTANEAGATEKEKVPVKTSRLLEGVLPGLRCQGGNILLQLLVGHENKVMDRTYVIIVEQ